MGGESRVPWIGELKIPTGFGGSQAGGERLVADWDAAEGHLGRCWGFQGYSRILSLCFSNGYYAASVHGGLQSYSRN